MIVTAGEAGKRFLAALRAADFAELANCLSPSVRFRALLPGGLADACGRDAAVSLLGDWLAGTGYAVVHARSDMIGPRLHLSYRVHLDAADGPRVMEQQAYCDVSTDGVSSVRLLCSGAVPLSRR